MGTRFEPGRGYVTNKHSRIDDVVITDKNGDVTRMSGTLSVAPVTRPYAEHQLTKTEPRHAKD